MFREYRAYCQQATRLNIPCTSEITSLLEDCDGREPFSQYGLCHYDPTRSSDKPKLHVRDTCAYNGDGLYGPFKMIGIARFIFDCHNFGLDNQQIGMT